MTEGSLGAAAGASVAVGFGPERAGGRKGSRSARGTGRSVAAGGLAEMSLIALSLNFNPVVVALHHLVRILMTVSIGAISSLKNPRSWAAAVRC